MSNAMWFLNKLGRGFRLWLPILLGLMIIGCDDESTSSDIDPDTLLWNRMLGSWQLADPVQYLEFDRNGSFLDSLEVADGSGAAGFRVVRGSYYIEDGTLVTTDVDRFIVPQLTAVDSVWRIPGRRHVLLVDNVLFIFQTEIFLNEYSNSQLNGNWQRVNEVLIDSAGVTYQGREMITTRFAEVDAEMEIIRSYPDNNQLPTRADYLDFLYEPPYLSFPADIQEGKTARIYTTIQPDYMYWIYPYHPPVAYQRIISY